MAYKHAISLIFEVSTGCQMNCSGCRVDVMATSMPSAENMQRIKALLDDFEAQDVPFAEIELGPTDLITTNNRDQIFESEDVAYITRKFQLVTLAASFVHPNPEEYARLAHQTHKLSPNNNVGLAIPVELKHVFNDKYIGRIKDNVEIFRQNLKNPLKEVILTVIFDERYLTNADGSKYTYEDLFARVHSLRVSHDTKVDFVFHHGREGSLSDPLIANNFLRSFRELNRHYLRDLRERAQAIETRHIPYQLMCNADGGELLYHDGQLYTRPVLNERVSVLHERMLFEGEWTADNYFFQKFNRLNNNIALGQSFPDCAGCDHLATCAARSVQDLMKITSTRKCITILKDHGGIHLVTDNRNMEAVDAQDFEKFY